MVNGAFPSDMRGMNGRDTELLCHAYSRKYSRFVRRSAMFAKQTCR